MLLEIRSHCLHNQDTHPYSLSITYILELEESLARSHFTLLRKVTECVKAQVMGGENHKGPAP